MGNTLYASINANGVQAKHVDGIGAASELDADPV